MGAKNRVNVLVDEDELRVVPVPYTELDTEVLQAVIESFVLREGTDYGERELTLQEKAARLLLKLKRGEAEIVFDPRTESVGITVKPALSIR